VGFPVVVAATEKHEARAKQSAQDHTFDIEFTRHTYTYPFFDLHTVLAYFNTGISLELPPKSKDQRHVERMDHGPQDYKTTDYETT
jgi:hypothetical protein